LQLLDIVHPAAKTLVDIAKSQDAEIGDGTTTVTLLAAELMKQSKIFIEDGVHPQIIIRGYRKAAQLAVERLNEIAISFENTPNAKRILLEKCAKTSLNSKLISRYQDFFAPMVVDAIDSLGSSLDLNMIGIKKVPGGSVTESMLIKGVAFKRTFSYAGFEQQPKHFANPKVLLLNLELELKSEKDNAEIRIDNMESYQAIVDAEWEIIYEKLRKCHESGAQIILSKLPIGDLATQYFADRGLFCAGRVSSDDLLRVSKATGARIQTTVNGLTPDVLGTCAEFQEKQIGVERYEIFQGCPHASTATLILRGGAEQFIDETERSIHDALMIVKSSIRSSTQIVAGGGAVEMEISKYLKQQSMKIAGKVQLIMLAFAKALEVIPRQLADNAGFDSTDILNRLRQKHAQSNDGTTDIWFGVDIDKEGITNTYESGVWEPVSSKINSLSSATEAACLILSIDETVRNPKSQQEGMQGGPGGGRGGQGIGKGKPMSAALGGQGMKAMMGGGGVRFMQGRGGK
jgi:T-complex protein 1 subunit eta